MKNAATMAPNATAEDMIPTPAGPTMNTSSAMAGNSDRGDPKTIATRSTTNVPSTGRWRRANRRPSMTAAEARPDRTGAGGIGAMSSRARIAAMYVTASIA